MWPRKGLDTTCRPARSLLYDDPPARRSHTAPVLDRLSLHRCDTSDPHEPPSGNSGGVAPLASLRIRKPGDYPEPWRGAYSVAHRETFGPESSSSHQGCRTSHTAQMRNPEIRSGRGVRAVQPNTPRF